MSARSATKRAVQRSLKARIFWGAVAVLSPLWAQAGVRSELHALRTQEAALQRGLDRTLRDRSQARDALRLAEDKVADIGRRLVRTRMREQGLRREIADLRARAARLRQTRNAERADVARQAAAAYMMGRAGTLQLLFSQENPRLVARMVQYYRYVVRARAQQIEAARRTLRALDKTTAAIRAKIRQARVVAKTESGQKRRLEGALARRKVLVSEWDHRAMSGRSRLRALRARAHRLETLLRGLRRLPQVPGRIPDLRGPFGDFKGRLPLPVPARFATLRASALRGGLNRWAGIVIPGRPGEEVRAVFSGRVVYANWLRGYGLLLILQDGDRYMTLYGHNQTLLKHVGDFVRGGEVIATVGDSGGFSRPGLYFDLSHNGQPLDPLAWLAH